MKVLNTFRGRLLLILAMLLIATLGFQYYLNLVTQNENNEIREKQEQTIAAAISIGISSLTRDDRIRDLIAAPDQTFFDDQARQRINDILIIDDKWQVSDSLSDEFLPTTDDDGEIVYKKLKDIGGLPAPMGASRLGADLRQFPNQTYDGARDDKVHAIPISTSRGRWYVIVVLKSDRNAAWWRAAQPLVYTLGVLLISTLITFLLVWRFARPISDLSLAAKKLAEGNLQVRVPDTRRRDEMGRLATNFNEMAAELEKTRDLEAQLQQAEKSAVVGRLGAAIAHEIRNPLNYINLTLDHLRAKFAPLDEQKRATFEKLTTQLKAEVGRVNQLISDFLNYSRPADPELTSVDARKVIEDSLRIIEHDALEKGITVSVVENEEVPNVLADAEFLRSVFNNLFINAVHAMESGGGHLGVKIIAEKSMVKIEVCDTGVGIPRENVAKIFEPYFSTKETGTGLGLAIVHKIVEMHDGEISVQSTVDEGTTFAIRLPIAS
ncbi:MAG: ATP-binding protein [Pyrinomonadaceae bacterium]